uniref:Uncharacterized protein n=1 Tax=viral metagenome TaxID=1070528 RepID=A0A6H1ZBE1_9ZZZZ
MSKPDEPTAAITRGLSGLLAALSTFEVTTSERFGDWTEDEELALDWLRMWVDAGAATLPKETP